MNEILDISRYQHIWGPIRWDDLKGQVSTVYVKATEGETYRNPYFGTDVIAGNNVGIHMGAYHYLSQAPGKAQGLAFLTAIRNMPLTMPPAVDVEINFPGVSDVLREFLETVEPITGPAIVYTYEHFQEFLAPEFGTRKIWLAAYRSTEPLCLGPWKDQRWWAWQYTGRGTCPGISGPVDRSRLNA